MRHKSADQKRQIRGAFVVRPLEAGLAVPKGILGDAADNIPASFLRGDGFGYRLSPRRIGAIELEGMRSFGVCEPSKKTSHSLRHIFMGNLANCGPPIQAVQTLARHAKIQATIGYAHSENMAEAVEWWVRWDCHFTNRIAGPGNGTEPGPYKSHTFTYRWKPARMSGAM